MCVRALECNHPLDAILLSQVKNMIYHAVKDAVAVLKETDP